ncbi:unnamed protein product, partial [Rotaria magnacalcarata]
LSSISELDLSVALQPINGISSLPLSTLDNQYYRIVNDEDADENTNLSIIPIQGTSDTESVLYLRLPYELNVATATFDSDLDKIEY